MIGNRTCKRIVTLSSVALLFGASAVFAQTPADAGQTGSSSSSASSMSSSKASMADKRFVKKAMEINMAEIQTGQLVAEKGNAQDVKDFGQKMVDDHTKLNDQMKPVAEQIGVTAPTELSPKDQALMTKLQGESGDQFDTTYIKAMVKGHRMALMAYKREEAHGMDQAVKAAATQGEPVIAEHLRLAEQLAKTHNVMTGRMHHHSKTMNGPTGMQ